MVYLFRCRIGLAEVYNDDLDNDENDDDFEADENDGSDDDDLAEEEEGEDDGKLSIFIFNTFLFRSFQTLSLWTIELHVFISSSIPF